MEADLVRKTLKIFTTRNVILMKLRRFCIFIRSLIQQEFGSQLIGCRERIQKASQNGPENQVVGSIFPNFETAYKNRNIYDASPSIVSLVNLKIQVENFLKNGLAPVAIKLKSGESYIFAYSILCRFCLLFYFFGDKIVILLKTLQTSVHSCVDIRIILICLVTIKNREKDAQ